jgi:hypothetical protein
MTLPKRPDCNANVPMAQSHVPSNLAWHQTADIVCERPLVNANVRPTGHMSPHFHRISAMMKTVREQVRTGGTFNV